MKSLILDNKTIRTKHFVQAILTQCAILINCKNTSQIQICFISGFLGHQLKFQLEQSVKNFFHPNQDTDFDYVS